MAKAGETIMVSLMIETAESVERIKDIPDFDGIDMVYLGPNDLAFALGGYVNAPRPKSEATPAE